MTLYLLLNDINSAINAMVNRSSTAHNHFNSFGANITNTHFSSQVQHFGHQVTQPSVSSSCNQYYNVFAQATINGLPTGYFKPFPSSNFSSFDTQALGNCDEFELSAIDDLPLSSLMPLQLPSSSNVLSQDLQNCVVSSTKSSENHVLTAFDNFTYMYLPKTQTVPNYQTYQPDLQQVLIPSSSLTEHSMKNALSLNNESVIPDTDKLTMRKRRTGFKSTKQYICHVPNCGKTYDRMGRFKNHLDCHAGKKRLRATKCQCLNCTAENGNKTRGSDGKLQHVCHFVGCKKVFNKVKYLNIHFKRHSGVKPYFCSWNMCEKNFITKSELTQHMKSHNNQSKCSCVNCSADDSRKVKDSKGRMQHICHVPGCGQVYIRVKNLRTHLKWHNGEKPYSCSFVACGKSFISKFALGAHMKAHKNLKVIDVQSSQQRVKENTTTEVFNGLPSRMPLMMSPSSVTIQNSLQISMHPTPCCNEDLVGALSYSGNMTLTSTDNSILSSTADSSTCQIRSSIQESLTSMFIDELAMFVKQTHSQHPSGFSN